jgi:hypothetical protein
MNFSSISYVPRNNLLQNHSKFLLRPAVGCTELRISIVGRILQSQDINCILWDCVFQWTRDHVQMYSLLFYLSH